ncbi:hypothetical protein LSAT2_009441 [Lamellibrachia satsuma]|nr:hypothetical protein LSAT2_009441 [Lamellibrachia satsuma]
MTTVITQINAASPTAECWFTLRRSRLVFPFQFLSSCTLLPLKKQYNPASASNNTVIATHSKHGQQTMEEWPGTGVAGPMRGGGERVAVRAEVHVNVREEVRIESGHSVAAFDSEAVEDHAGDTALCNRGLSVTRRPLFPEPLPPSNLVQRPGATARLGRPLHHRRSSHPMSDVVPSDDGRHRKG